MKPIIRWTVGNVSDAGFECLIVSHRLMLEIYGDQFDYYICHNNLNPIHLEKLKTIGCNLVDQLDYSSSLPFLPKGTCWKLHPPRLRIDSHEIFIDNDLIIYKRMPIIDQFLAGKFCMITSAHRVFYGQFRFLAQDNMQPINSGFFGIPPNYDLEGNIRRFLFLYGSLGWKDHCDDEGVLSHIFRSNLNVIPMSDIWVCNPMTDFAKYNLGEYGTHFAGLNTGADSFWEHYKEEFTTEKQRGIFNI